MERQTKSIPLEPKLQSMRQLAVSALSPSPQDVDRLIRFAPFCTELTITVDLAQQQQQQPTSNENWFRRLRRSEPGEGSSSRSSSTSWELVKSIVKKEDIGKHFRKMSEPKASAKAAAATAAVKQSGATSAKIGNVIIDLSTLNQWTNLLAKCHSLEMLIIRVNGAKGWTTTGNVEDMLCILRTALEYAGLPKLKHIRLQPISIMGIIQFRWSDTATSASFAEQAAIVWRNVDQLDIQLQNPFATLNESHRSVVLHTLHDYLANFASSLKCLRFIWLGDSGPSPLALHKEKGLAGLCRPIIWQELEEVWLGNIRFLDPAVRGVSAQAPVIRRIMTLLDRCAYRSDVFDYKDAWIEFLLGNTLSNPTVTVSSEQQAHSGVTDADEPASSIAAHQYQPDTPRMLDYYAGLYEPSEDDEESSSHPAWI